MPFAGRGIELDDLIQEARIALLGAAKTFDASRGVKLWTYARIFVIGALIKFVSDELAEPGRADDNSIPEFSDQEAQSAEDNIATGQCISIASRELSRLTEIERRVLRAHFVDGLDLREISRQLTHSSCVTVQRIYHGALAKLKERVEATV